jgi:thiol-disulfide isomerase/thioredoxin
VVVGGLLYVAVTTFKPGGGLRSLAKGEMAKLVVDDKPQSQPITAQDAQGRTVRLSDLKDQVVVVNLWATWCAPCVKEMPTLARLQSEYAGKPVKVVAISLDKGDEDVAKARAFIADKPPLKFYHGDYSLAFALTPAVEGLPTTLIFDRQGRERARLTGGADWSTPAAKAVIDRLLAQS